MSRDMARIEFTSSDDCRLVVEVQDEQFRFDNGMDDHLIWIDFDDVPQLVAFMLAMKDG